MKIESCLLRESRTISLLLRPRFRVTLLSIWSSSGSSLIVIALFMSYNVIQKGFDSKELWSKKPPFTSTRAVLAVSLWVHKFYRPGSVPLMNWLIFIFTRKKWTFFFLLLITPLGFYTKYYSGPASQWVHNSMGGILYVLFWSLFVSLFIAKPPVFKIATIVFLLTCIIELLQLWQPAFLMHLRSTFIGRTILGTSFSPFDFLHYFLGFILSIVLLKFITRHEPYL